MAGNRWLSGSSDPLFGKRLGSYILESTLGEGGMGRVYLARHHELGGYAAIKVIQGSAQYESREAERFRREARSLFELKHPGIVDFIEFGVVEDLCYLAVEYVDGADLEWVLRQYRLRGERMPLEAVVDIVTQVADALASVHEHGIIHRDVKPSNILLDRTGRVLLTDFGLALNASESTSGMVFGSAHYVSPEQALSSENAVPQSDIYSLGAVLYEMLTGSPPFDGETLIAITLKHLNETPRTPRELNPEIPAALEKTVLRALAKPVEGRYRSMSSFARALRKAWNVSRSEHETARSDGTQSISPDGTDAGSGAHEADSSSEPQSSESPLLEVVRSRTSLPRALTWGNHQPVKSRPRMKILRTTLVLAPPTLLGAACVIAALGTLQGRGLWSGLEAASGLFGSSVRMAEGTQPAPAAGSPPLQPTDLPRAADSAGTEDGPTFQVSSCHGYRFVSRLRPGMYAFAVLEVPLYDLPRYEHNLEAGRYVVVLDELKPGDRVLILDHESYPNCYREASFWKVRTESGSEGWVHEWRFQYYLAP